MADQDRHTPEEDAEQGAVPDPHRHEPPPRPDSHTRAEPGASVVRPDQQEELGPLEGLMHAAAVEATAEATGDPEAKAEAVRLGVEDEGVEAAQIFGILLATAVTLALAVVGVFVLVGTYADAERVERNAVTLYPELREVQRVAAEMENYSRTDSLYRLPIGAAMNQVAEAYYARQQGGDAVPAPDHFNTLYLGATLDSGVPLREESGQTATGSDSLSQGAGAIPEPGVGPSTGEGTPGAGAEEGTVDAPAETPSPTTSDEPEDR